MRSVSQTRYIKGKEMKGIICYYSGSGNTKLACEYIKKKISNADLELYNIIRNVIPDFSVYDIVGFATFTDFWGVPQYFHDFFERINSTPGMNAFAFNTYGFISGKTLRQLIQLAKNKQLNVFAGYSLHTPENYPPMRVRNMTFDNAPKPSELKNFDAFISKLDFILGGIAKGKETEKEIKIGLINRILPAFARTQAKKDFGQQDVDKSICTKCGVCAKGCPYEAINLNPYPVFDHSKCFGCWFCYNHCPTKAIFTKKFNGIGHYSKPINTLMDKLYG